VVPASVAGKGEPNVCGQMVSTNYFTMNGVVPPLGGLFWHRRTDAPVVIISDGLWEEKLRLGPVDSGQTVWLTAPSTRYWA